MDENCMKILHHFSEVENRFFCKSKILQIFCSDFALAEILVWDGAIEEAWVLAAEGHLLKSLEEGTAELPVATDVPPAPRQAPYVPVVYLRTPYLGVDPILCCGPVFTHGPCILPRTQYLAAETAFTASRKINAPTPGPPVKF